MKKKFALVLTMLLLVTSITGCSMPSFGNKGEEESPSDSEVVTTFMTAKEGIEIEDGTVVSVDTIVDIDPAKAGEVSQLVIMMPDGSVSTEFETSGEGPVTVTVVVEYIDGTSESVDVTLTVTGKDVLELMSDNLKNNVLNYDWDVLTVPVYNSTDSFSVSHSEKLTLRVDETTLSDGVSFEGSTSEEMSWVVIGLTKSDEEALATEGNSPLRNTTNLNKMLDMLAMFMSMDTDLGEESTELANKMIEYLKQFMQEIVKVSSEVTDYVMYDEEGTSYPVKVVYHTVDGQEYGYGINKYPVIYYVDYTDTTRLLFTDSTVEVGEWQTPDEEQEEESGAPFELEDFKTMTYDEFKTAMTSTPDGWSMVSDMYTEKTPTIGDMVDNIILGSYEAVKPAEEVQESEQPEVTETPAEQTVEVETPTEEIKEETTTSANKRVTYAQKYPQLFTWQNSEDAATYRRWYYIINDSTSFVGTIRYPDGTVIEGDEVFDEGFRYDTTNGEESNRNDYREDGQKIQTYKITSNYETYTVTTANTSRTLDVLTSESTSDRAVIKYGDNRFYIQTVRPYDISSFMTTSFYSTSNYQGGEFTVKEGSSNQVKQTDYGKIVPYTVTYKNTKGTSVTEQYMAIYNINNDYLVCYADNLTGTDDLFSRLLEELVIR